MLKKAIKRLILTLGHTKHTRLAPITIGITGSVGKTTQKDILNTVLKGKYDTFASKGNRNVALSLSIDVLKFLKPRHKVMIAEMGMDVMHEIRDTCKIIHPNIAVITNISPTHLEKLVTLENIIETKAEIIDCQTEDETTLLNADDKNVAKLANRGKSVKILYSTKDTSADVYISNLKETIEAQTFTINFKEKYKPIQVQLNVIGEHYLYHSLVSAYIAKELGLTNEQVATGLKKITGTPGRQNMIKGINNSTIIDDTYNSNLDSAKKLVDVTLKVSKNSPILILGDMLELGAYEETAHNELVGYVAKKKLKSVIFVGPRLRKAANEMNYKNAKLYSNSDEGKNKILKDISIEPGNVIGIKGSRGLRTEKFIEVLEA